MWRLRSTPGSPAGSLKALETEALHSRRTRLPRRCVDAGTRKRQAPNVVCARTASRVGAPGRFLSLHTCRARCTAFSRSGPIAACIGASGVSTHSAPAALQLVSARSMAFRSTTSTRWRLLHSSADISMFHRYISSVISGSGARSLKEASRASLSRSSTLGGSVRPRSAGPEVRVLTSYSPSSREAPGSPVAILTDIKSSTLALSAKTLPCRSCSRGCDQASRPRWPDAGPPADSCDPHHEASELSLPQLPHRSPAAASRARPWLAEEFFEVPPEQPG